MAFKPNQSGIDKMFADIAANIEKVDAQIRAEWAGRPAEQIEAPAVAAFAAIGINFATLADYAVSVSENEPFTLNIS